MKKATNTEDIEIASRKGLLRKLFAACLGVILATAGVVSAPAIAEPTDGQEGQEGEETTQYDVQLSKCSVGLDKKYTSLQDIPEFVNTDSISYDMTLFLMLIDEATVDVKVAVTRDGTELADLASEGALTLDNGVLELSKDEVEVDEGVYVLTVSGGRLNESVTFTVDRTNPTADPKMGAASYSWWGTDYYYDKATLNFNITEANLASIDLKWTLNDAQKSVTLSDSEDFESYDFTGEGEYSDIELVITDKAGNKVEKSLDDKFEIIATSPSLSADDVKLVDGDKTFTYEDLTDDTADYIATNTPEIRVDLKQLDGNNSTVTVLDSTGTTTTYAASELDWSYNWRNGVWTATIPEPTSDKPGIADGPAAMTVSVAQRGRSTKTLEYKFGWKEVAEGEDPATDGKLIFDTKNPVVSSISWVNGSNENKGHYKANRTATVTITEANFDKSNADSWIHYAKGSQKATSIEWEHDDSANTHKATLLFDADGSYDFSVYGEDLAGNESVKQDSGAFVIDKTAPVVEIEWDNTDVRNEKYYAKARTATVTITETNFDEDDADSWIIYADGSDKAESLSWEHRGSTHTATLKFKKDGDYDFSVSGEDIAGNASNTVDPDAFVIDTVDPIVSFVIDNKEYETFESKKYFDDKALVTVKVVEHNFDANLITVTAEGSGELEWSHDGDTHTVELTSINAEGDHSISVYGTDLALNGTKDESNNAVTKENPLTEEFVIDLTAPKIDKVNVNNDPASTAEDDDLYYFYNQKTTMAITASDNYPIARAAVAYEGLSFFGKLNNDDMVDPDGTYNAQLTLSDDAKTATVSIALEEGKDSENHDVKDFQDNVILTIWDVAGNMRTWSISPNGTVKDVSGSSKANTSINGEQIYPNTLVQDTVAPVISYNGPEEGKYYNENQSMSLGVYEYNFGRLQLFDGDRVVMTIHVESGDASRSKSEVVVTAKELKGSDPSYSFPYTFDTDGHYSIDASFEDYATNMSNVIRVGEFTIDKTAPLIEVNWDNNDVKNGKYYSAGRTAIITVTEHNFDESLFTVETTGSMSGWSHNGDTHTMTVTCGEDGGVYSLKVNGEDMAGNAAVEYVEDEFIVDMSAPEINFGGEFGDHILEKKEQDNPDDLVVSDATNGVVKPVITYTDKPAQDGSEPYDTIDATYTLTRLDGEDAALADDPVLDNAVSGGEYHVSFNDFGYDEVPDEQGLNYALEADGVYRLDAHVQDFAGNAADNSIIFSVNRYGSAFYVQSVYTYDSAEKEHRDEATESMVWLDEEPSIIVHAVDVSENTGHYVTVERPDAQTPSLEVATEDVVKSATNRDYEGYTFSTLNDGSEGWYEYSYSIGSGNFGADHGGEGSYIVTIAADDSAGNISTSESFYDREGEGNLSKAQVSFFLDSIGPEVQIIDPNAVEIGGEYYLQFQVIDEQKLTDEKIDLTIDGVSLDDAAIQALKDDGSLVGPDSAGNYSLKIAHKTILDGRNVEVKATDWIDRSADDSTDVFRVTNLVLEITALILVLGGGTAAGVYQHYKKKSGPRETYTFL